VGPATTTEDLNRAVQEANEEMSAEQAAKLAEQ